MRTVRSLLPFLAWLVIGCGGDGDEATPSNQGGKGGASGGSGAAGSAGAAGAGAGGAAAGVSGSSGQSGSAGAGGAACTDGTPCKGANDTTGLCAGGVCCEASLACGSVCCGGSQVCSFGKCVAPGKSCQDASDCGAAEYCEVALTGGSGQGGASGASGASGGSGEAGTAGGPGCGPAVGAGKCLPLPPLCPEGQTPGNGPLTCLPTCEVKPPTKPFEVELKYAWGGQTESPFASDVMMTPIVIQLDDDDCDGKVTARDVPEIVFTTFSGGAYNDAGTLHAISIVGGQFVEKWSVPGVIIAAGELAAGNIDGEPGNEVVGCGKDGYMYAFRGDGTQLWKSAEPAPCRMPTIADLDQDGQPEIIEYTKILNGKDGTTKLSYSGGGYVVTSDFDGDGKLDMVSGNTITRGDGTPIASITSAGSWGAVGDLDRDGVPEVITADSGAHLLRIWHLDSSGQPVIVRAGIDLNGTLSPSLCPVGSAGNTHGGGPPTVADFNGDGFPDIALAGGVGYAIFDGKKLMDASVADSDVVLWSKQTQDCSSAATGSSIFDFNGDGKAEVLYSDEVRFRIYDGPTGDVVFETCNTTGTLIENPIVADVDGDDQADIIVASNAYALTCDGTKQSGIRVFGSKNHDWVRTRRVWNQHAYHVTNIEEDGTVPTVEQPNWKQPGLNNFRQNKQPGLEFAAPDAIVTVRPACDAGNRVLADVRNIGQSAMRAGATVSVVRSDAPATKLGEASTTRVLYPGQSEALLFTVSDPDVGSGKAKVIGSVSVAPGDTECRTDNNTSDASSGTCSSVIN